MLSLLSPAKKLLPDFKPYTHVTSQPILINNALELASIMKSKSVKQIAELMHLSDDLAELNFNRYQEFHLTKKTSVKESYPALFLFQGDVYQGLDAESWSETAVDFAQSHLAILSGLYGLLKPLDTIQPYRLEMGTKLHNPKGTNLYDYWGDLIANQLNHQLSSHTNQILINLASQEYFKAVYIKKLKYPVLTINFYEKKDNQQKMIGIYAKKARGTIAKFIMKHHIDDLEQIKEFSDLGYHFDKKTSTEADFNFIRVSK